MLIRTKRSRENDQSKCPPAEVWASLLEEDSSAPQLSEHLEHCAACRSALEHTAAEENVWNDAVDSLSAPSVELSRLSRSICPFSDQPAALDRGDALCEHEVQSLQQLLPAPSHPELLARIGRYELEQLVGRGGMGLVFRAHDVELHRVVAVKTLALHLLPISAARERFVREGRASAGLSHPNIVPTYDVIPDNPVPALVMQYIAGPTLEHRVQHGGPLGLQEVCRLGAQIADALSAAHAQSLVHRDLKPANVLLEADGARALLTDFGLVRALHDATLTVSGSLAGTPHCMAPEQIRGKEIDCRADLFSLGTLLYFMAAGSYPFEADEPMAVLHAICHEPHVSLSKLNPSIPRSLSRLVDRLLAKSPEHRFATAAEVRDSLRQLADPRFRADTPVRQSSRLRSRSAAARLIVASVLIASVAGTAWIRPDWFFGDVTRNSNSPFSGFAASTMAGNEYGHAGEARDAGETESSPSGEMEEAGSAPQSSAVDVEAFHAQELQKTRKLARDLDRLTEQLFSEMPPEWNGANMDRPVDSTLQINQLLRRLDNIQHQVAQPYNFAPSK